MKNWTISLLMITSVIAGMGLHSSLTSSSPARPAKNQRVVTNHKRNGIPDDRKPAAGVTIQNVGTSTYGNCGSYCTQYLSQVVDTTNNVVCYSIATNINGPGIGGTGSGVSCVPLQ